MTMDIVPRIIAQKDNALGQTPWGGWSATFMSIGFLVFQFTIAALLGVVLVLSMLGTTVFEGGFSAGEVKMLIDIAIISFAISYFLTIGLIVFVSSLRGGRARDVLLLGKPVQFVFNLIVGVVLLVMFFGLMSYVIETFFANDARQNDAQMKQIFTALKSSNLLWGGIAIVVIGAPIVEEMIFRGFLLNSLSTTRLGFWGGAVVSSLLWSLVHGYAASMAVGLFVFGLLLSLMVKRTGSIWISIILHSFWNGIVTAGMFVALGNSVT